MSRTIRPLLVAALLVGLALAFGAGPAQASSCSASGIFSSCRADCDPGETPVCSVGFLGFSVSCTCIKNNVPNPTSMSLSVEGSQEIAFADYHGLLHSFGSAEAAAAAEAAEAMQAAARANDVDAYLRAAAAHDAAVAELGEDERQAIEDWADGARPQDVD